MRIKILVIALVFITSTVQTLLANEKPGEEISTLKKVGIVAAVEGLAALNSYVASLYPREYGITAAIITPINGGEGSSNTVTALIAAGSVEALCVYNILLEEDDFSEGEIFRNNLIGWHVVAGVIALSEHIWGDALEDENIDVGFSPMKGGGKFLVSYSF